MKKKIFKIILILIFIIFFLICINTLRNYFILMDLKEKVGNLKKLDSFEETLEYNNGSQRIIKNKDIVKIEKDSEDYILYFDTKNNEMIKENIETHEKILYPEVIASFNLILPNLEKISLKTYIGNFITTKNINNEKFYKIKIYDEEMTYYISAETGLVMRAYFDENYEDYTDYKDYVIKDVLELKFDKSDVLLNE